MKLASLLIQKLCKWIAFSIFSVKTKDLSENITKAGVLNQIFGSNNAGKEETLTISGQKLLLTQ